MSPNMSPSVPSFSSRMTVAQRKEANELRKTLKPLMEKRRRARINESIDRLKALVVPLSGKDTQRYSKLEKADILEMTVQFLKAIPPSPARADSYREGYKACLRRVSALLPCTNLSLDECARIKDFIRNSESAAPTCRNCSPKSAVGSHRRAPEPSVSGDRSQPAATEQPMWRPW